MEDRGWIVQAEMHSLRRFEPDYFLQRFTSPPLAFQPGQFVMVKPSGSLDLFLPRAYSILRVQRLSTGSRGKKVNVVEILYKVLGKGTTALSQLKPGDRVDLLGPLGNGYHVAQGVTTAILVAGGIGVPPVVALAERLASSRFTVHGVRASDVGHRTRIVGRRTSTRLRRAQSSRSVEPSSVIGRWSLLSGGKAPLTPCASPTFARRERYFTWPQKMAALVIRDSSRICSNRTSGHRDIRLSSVEASTVTGQRSMPAVRIRCSMPSLRSPSDSRFPASFPWRRRWRAALEHAWGA